jgi:hypothetical protein
MGDRPKRDADRAAKDHALPDTLAHVGRRMDDFTVYSWYENVKTDNAHTNHERALHR